MSADRSAFFESNELCCVQSGYTELSVPLLEDVIQIDAAGKDRIGKILVEKDSYDIAVTRSDGAPLQVAVVSYSRRRTDNNGIGLNIIRSLIFDEPVPELLFKQSVAPTGGLSWYAQAENMGAPDLENLRRLAWSIGTFATLKQGGSFFNRTPAR